ncbi:hypothetical protein NBRC3255_0314 [Gluconobacter thailandicus NBRC 3255]|nr:hypothetical protein NBRC3255_0314 [Gluconobacter thailandicus NBRC 3255]
MAGCLSFSFWPLFFADIVLLLAFALFVRFPIRNVEKARLRTHSQNMMVAARQMAEKKTVGHLS